MIWEVVRKVGLLKLCDNAFSEITLPILPFPSSNGWIRSKYKWANPVLPSAESSGFPPLSILLTRLLKVFIAEWTCLEGGGLK